MIPLLFVIVSCADEPPLGGPLDVDIGTDTRVRDRGSADAGADPAIDGAVDVEAGFDTDTTPDAPLDGDVAVDADVGEDVGQGGGGVSIVLANPAEEDPTLLMSEDGGDLVFTVNPEFSGALSYTWFLNGDELADEDGETLVITKVDIPIGLNRIAVVLVTADGWTHSGELSIIVSEDDGS